MARFAILQRIATPSGLEAFKADGQPSPPRFPRPSGSYFAEHVLTAVATGLRK
jgi:hypothetical protein